MEQKYVLMIFCTLLNLEGIYSALRIYDIMVIILKPTIKAMKNIFILMVSGQKLILEKLSIYLLGYIIEELKQMLQCTRSAPTTLPKYILCFGMIVLDIWNQ
jgi:hypothetical protein